MLPDQVRSLHNIEAKHHVTLVKIGSALSNLSRPTDQSPTGYTPWHILPNCSSLLLDALKWYQDDKGMGMFPGYLSSPPQERGCSEGLFEARFFALFSALRYLSETISMVKDLYNTESGWFPTSEATYMLACYDFSKNKDIKPAEMALNHDVIINLESEIKDIYKEFSDVVNSIWSGGW